MGDAPDVTVALTAEERALKRRQDLQEWFAKEAKLKNIPGLGGIFESLYMGDIGLPPETSTMIVEFLSMIWDRVEKFFGASMDRLHQWWDANGFALVKAIRDQVGMQKDPTDPNKTIDPIAVKVKTTLEPLDALTPGLSNELAAELGPKIRAIITSSNYDPTGRQLAGQQARKAVRDLIIARLGPAYGEPGKATVETLANALAEKIGVGTEEFLAQAATLKDRIATMTPDDIATYVQENFKLDLSIATTQDGNISTAVSALGTIKEANAATTRAKEAALAKVLTDIQDDGITLTEPQKAFITSLVMDRDGIDPAKVDTLVKLVDKEIWTEILAKQATKIQIRDDDAGKTDVMDILITSASGTLEKERPAPAR